MGEVPDLDARGLHCPLPLLKLKQRLNRMEAGDRIKVTTTDPGSVRDFAVFTQQVGHIIHEQTHLKGEYLFVIEKLA